MPRLTRGARSALDLISDELGAVREYAREIRKEARRDPRIVEDATLDLLQSLEAVERILREHVEPLLQRREAAQGPPSVLERLERLETELQQIRDDMGRLSEPRAPIIPIRKGS